MALPTILINSSGSNTAASGAGPSTALSGTAAALASSTTVTLSVDAPDLSGVATDGSAVIWVDASSGRQFAKITAVDNVLKTVTVSDAYAVTESSRNWGIGGKRASLGGSLQLGLDVRAGWSIDVQTGETLTATWRLNPNNATSGSPVTLYSSASTHSGGLLTGPILTTSTNAVQGLDIAGADSIQVKGIYFKSTAATPGTGIGPASASGCIAVTISDCVVDGFNIGIRDIDSGNNVNIQGLILERVEVLNCKADGVKLQNGNGRCKMDGCYIHGNNTGGTVAIGGVTIDVGDLAATHCIFDGNKVSNVYATLNGARCCEFSNCVFSNAPASSDGLFLNDNGGAALMLKNCIIYGNAAYGVNGSSSTLSGLDSFINLNNAYGANTTADRRYIGAGTGDVSLSANPFTSSTDFKLNNTAGGGAACKNAGATPLGSATVPVPDIGAY